MFILNLFLAEPTNEANIARVQKTEVHLVLSNKFEVPESDDMNINRLFIKTKELLVSVLQFLNGETLVEALETSTSPIQERLYSIRRTSLSPLLQHNRYDHLLFLLFIKVC